MWHSFRLDIPSPEPLVVKSTPRGSPLAALTTGVCSAEKLMQSPTRNGPTTFKSVSTASAFFSIVMRLKRPQITAKNGVKCQWGFPDPHSCFYVILTYSNSKPRI